MFLQIVVRCGKVLYGGKCRFPKGEVWYRIHIKLHGKDFENGDLKMRLKEHD